MKIFISSLNVPIGYTVPRFPSLYWPLGAQEPLFQQLFLHYLLDMWRFTVLWLLIFFGGFYFLTGLLAAGIQLRNRLRHATVTRTTVIESAVIIALYSAMGLFQGFVGGLVVGLLVLSIYKAGALSMSTWIPFVWAIAQVLFNVCSSYSLSLIML
jgi:hypothetical protein